MKTKTVRLVGREGVTPQTFIFKVESLEHSRNPERKTVSGRHLQDADAITAFLRTLPWETMRALGEAHPFFQTVRSIPR